MKCPAQRKTDITTHFCKREKGHSGYHVCRVGFYMFRTKKRVRCIYRWKSKVKKVKKEPKLKFYMSSA